MYADHFLQFLTQALYVAIFVVVAVQAARRPRRVHVDIALLFGAIVLIIAVEWGRVASGAPTPVPIATLVAVLLMALPYLLLRLVDDFARVPTWLLRAAEAGLLASAVILAAVPAPLPAGLVILLVGYFVALVAYAALAFRREARRGRGVTRRRLQAVGLGSVFLGLTILCAGLTALLPAWTDAWTLLSRLGGLASGLAYFLGFAPPTWLRRAWQEPELRAFLGRAASLPRLPDTLTIVRELERGAASALGAPNAAIGLWDEASQRLLFYTPAPPAGNGPPGTIDPSAPTAAIESGYGISGAAFAAQQAVFVDHTARAAPELAALYREYSVRAMLVAPITAGDRRLGVLVVYGPRASVFADSDLELVCLLADQAAVILESRALIDAAARVQAREEAARLKDDFLSSAAHDLRTPLTTVLGQAQVLARRASRDGLPAPYLEGLDRLVREARRLSGLVRELLDASRVEQGQLVGEREAVDLVVVAHEACERLTTEQHRCIVDAAGPTVGEYDRLRVQQLLDNLVENAVKYSPDGGTVHVRVWCEGAEARVSVRDEGIGIPPDDVPQLFERYHRGANVDDRRFSGLGLGLYICRGIVDAHGGRIWAVSQPGRGTAMEVALPLGDPVAMEGSRG
jgi:signal transduction histidine kinase